MARAKNDCLFSVTTPALGTGPASASKNASTKSSPAALGKALADSALCCGISLPEETLRLSLVLGSLRAGRCTDKAAGGTDRPLPGETEATTIAIIMEEAEATAAAVVL